jgi:DNA-binding response OmpR family regulator
MDKILLIDDDPSVEEQLKQPLKEGGYALYSMSNPADALDLINKEPPDLILLDFSIPAYSVETFVEELSRVAEKRIPVVLLVTMAEMEQAPAHPGIAGFVIKPINIAQLKAHVELIFGMNAPREKAPEPSSEVPASVVPEPERTPSGDENFNDVNVLIIDDDNDMVVFLTEALKLEGFKVTSAVDGYEGLVKAQAEKPDIILLDIMMPKMDGFQVCRLLKYSERFSKVPIIMLTARVQPEDQQTALHVAGADAYITKPFRISEVVERVKYLLTHGVEPPAKTR